MLDVIKLMRNGLKPKQIIALQFLLLEPNKAAAAQYVGVSRTTIWRWMKNPVFAEALKDGMREQIDAINQELCTRSIL